MDTKQVLLRLPVELVAQVDERCALVGLSRNEWFALVARWRLEMPLAERTVVRQV